MKSSIPTLLCLILSAKVSLAELDIVTPTEGEACRDQVSIDPDIDPDRFSRYYFKNLFSDRKLYFNSNTNHVGALLNGNHKFSSNHWIVDFAVDCPSAYKGRDACVAIYNGNSRERLACTHFENEGWEKGVHLIPGSKVGDETIKPHEIWVWETRPDPCNSITCDVISLRNAGNRRRLYATDSGDMLSKFGATDPNGEILWQDQKWEAYPIMTQVKSE
ncbi:unknown protein [Seminavis robusta]|uniref:Uncharacterized protein n=1 Tax=Seminavis robusta TaxID=568900 RepID=A0A9N8EP61_9STRA|nr:unknown protein [Seminavis robusta]|eukprot:Sro1356_g265700.1 n/a (218) ;mRNA; f:13044-13697